MQQYLLSVVHDSVEGLAQLSEAEMQETFAAVDAFNAKLQKGDAWVFAGGLSLPDSATTLRRKGDDVLVTDGPYAETKEFVGGFYIINAPDLDAALAWAKEAVVACRGAIEVRPFQDAPED
jgi:hypothetical protein